jgi:hypothetical protein
MGGSGLPGRRSAAWNRGCGPNRDAIIAPRRHRFGMVVRKAANMALRLGIRIIGLVENMSHVICPQCGTQIDVFGKSRVDQTTRLIGIPLLGRLPFDPEIARLCDQGEIERYLDPVFEEIVDRITEITP